MRADAWSAERFAGELAALLLPPLRERRDATALAASVAACAAAAERLCRGRPCACGPGCPHCCVLNVAVLLPEALGIAAWLEAQLAPAALAALRGRLAEHRRWARWMDDEERILRRERCPFLDGAGRCGIHPLRPLACRGVASLDRRRCAAAFDPGVGDAERCVPADLLRRAAYDTAFAVLGEVLSLSGLEGRSIELGSGVLAFLEHPGYRADYLAGRSLPARLWG